MIAIEPLPFHSHATPQNSHLYYDYADVYQMTAAITRALAACKIVTTSDIAAPFSPAELLHCCRLYDTSLL